MYQVLASLVENPLDGDSPPPTTLNLIPQTSLREFWLPLSAFDVSARSKSGCGDGETCCFYTCSFLINQCFDQAIPYFDQLICQPALPCQIFHRTFKLLCTSVSSWKMATGWGQKLCKRNSRQGTDLDRSILVALEFPTAFARLWSWQGSVWS